MRGIGIADRRHWEPLPSDPHPRANAWTCLRDCLRWRKSAERDQLARAAAPPAHPPCGAAQPDSRHGIESSAACHPPPRAFRIAISLEFPTSSRAPDYIWVRVNSGCKC